MTTLRELRLGSDRRTLSVVWDDLRADIGAELLRVESPSAEVKGHGPGQERLVAGKRDVGISSLEQMGNYAVKIVFSDGHQTGIYTWDYLRKLACEQETLWQAYLDKIKAAGLSR